MPELRVQLLSDLHLEAQRDRHGRVKMQESDWGTAVWSPTRWATPTKASKFMMGPGSQSIFDGREPGLVYLFYHL